MRMRFLPYVLFSAALAQQPAPVSQPAPLPQIAPSILGGDSKPALALSSPAMRLTISQQTSPYALPRGMNLYSAGICTDPTETRTRSFAAGRIKQAWELDSESNHFTDPGLLPPMIAAYVKRTLTGRLLTVTTYLGDGLAGAGATVAAVKTNQPSIGNAHTWDLIATAGAALGIIIPMTQKTLQSDVTAQQAQITTGVKAELVMSTAQIFSVPAFGGCYSIMFTGSGNAKMTGVIQ